MNGALFTRLANLQLVDLTGNSCINENFKENHIVILADEATKQCGTLKESDMEQFITEWRNSALASQKGLSHCLTQTEIESKDTTIRRIHEKLESLMEYQSRQQTLLENFHKDERIKEQNLQETNEKLIKAEFEMENMRKQNESLRHKNI